MKKVRDADVRKMIKRSLGELPLFNVASQRVVRMPVVETRVALIVLQTSNVYKPRRQLVTW